MSLPIHRPMYFTSERPEPSIAASCTGYNNWKYGMESRPAYLAGQTVASLEQTYVARRVSIYWGRWTPIQIIRRWTKPAWRRRKDHTDMSAVMLTSPRCKPETLERRTTASGTFKVWGTTETRC